jgi:hypothetical protein
MVARPGYAKGGSMAVVSLIQDDESVASGAISALVEQDLRKSGIRVVSDPDDADLVVVTTAGRLGSMARYGAGISRAGLLLTAFKSSEWSALSDSGKLPDPVWRIFASGDYSQGELAPGARELAATAVAQVPRASDRPVEKKSGR